MHYLFILLQCSLTFGTIYLYFCSVVSLFVPFILLQCSFTFVPFILLQCSFTVMHYLFILLQCTITFVPFYTFAVQFHFWVPFNFCSIVSLLYFILVHLQFSTALSLYTLCLLMRCWSFCYQIFF